MMQASMSLLTFSGYVTVRSRATNEPREYPRTSTSCIFRDDMSKEQTNNFVNQMSAIRKRKPHNYNLLRKYLIYASTIEVRTITPEAEYMLNEFRKGARAQETLTMRMYGGLFSISEAQAKLYLKNTIDEEIAKQTMESVQLMIVQHGQTIKVTLKYQSFLLTISNGTRGRLLNTAFISL